MRAPSICDCHAQVGTLTQQLEDARTALADLQAAARPVSTQVWKQCVRLCLSLMPSFLGWEVSMSRTRLLRDIFIQGAAVSLSVSSWVGWQFGMGATTVAGGWSH